VLDHGKGDASVGVLFDRSVNEQLRSGWFWCVFCRAGKGLDEGGEAENDGGGTAQDDSRVSLCANVGVSLLSLSQRAKRRLTFGLLLTPARDPGSGSTGISPRSSLSSSFTPATSSWRTS
jgi:hypothetical protein